MKIYKQQNVQIECRYVLQEYFLFFIFELLFFSVDYVKCLFYIQPVKSFHSFLPLNQSMDDIIFTRLQLCLLYYIEQRFTVKYCYTTLCTKEIKREKKTRYVPEGNNLCIYFATVSTLIYRFLFLLRK